MSPLKPLSLKEAEAALAKANVKASEGDLPSALELYVKAAEAFLHLSRKFGDDPRLSIDARANLKVRCRENASKALERAQQIKITRSTKRGENGSSWGELLVRNPGSTRFTEEEQFAIADRSSRINGLKFPPWIFPPPQSDFESTEMFLDPDGRPALSAAQSEALSEWKRPPFAASDFQPCVTSPDLTVDEIVQDVVTDCSVVAALAVCWEHHLRFDSKLCTSAIYPQDDHGIPYLSASGKYIVRLLINGTPRQIAIDDQFPVAADGQLLCASTRRNVLWPSIIEKAYLKLNGGYDFPGSNPSVDLHALVGWIPEQIELQSPNLQREKVWQRLYQGFNNGKCLVTLGTGATVRKSSLVPLHSYAAIGFIEDNGSRKFRLLNPWKSDRVRDGDSSGIAGHMQSSAMSASRTDWMELDEICQVFDTIHVNWNPDIFPFSHSLHGLWRSDKPSDRCNQHFRFSVGPLGSKQAYPMEMWCLLSRHLTSRDLCPEFVALNVAKQAEGENLSRGDLLRLQDAYTSGVHVLARMTITRDGTDVSVVASRDVDGSETEERSLTTAYTLAVYSMTELKVIDPLEDIGYVKKIESSFTTKTAGGSWNHRTFMHNPQFSLRIQTAPGKPTPVNGLPVRLIVEGSRHVPVSAKIVWADGKRVTELRQGDIALDTGPYAYGVTIGERKLKPGQYTVILSTFEPGHQCPISFTLEAAGPIALDPIPHEGAGMFSKIIKGSWQGLLAAGNPSFGNYQKNPMYEIRIPCSTTFFCRLQLLPTIRSSVAVNVTIFKKNGAIGLGDQVLTTGAYAERVCGVASDPLLIDGPATYVAVLSTFEPNVEADFELVMYSSACAVNAKAL